jgi:hypothetical protein
MSLFFRISPRPASSDFPIYIYIYIYIYILQHVDVFMIPASSTIKVEFYGVFSEEDDEDVEEEEGLLLGDCTIRASSLQPFAQVCYVDKLTCLRV